MLGCLQHQLQRRQPLLTVDDLAPWETECGVWRLLQDDSAQKVRCDRLASRIENAVSRPTNVVPERLPLVVLLPHVGSLEEWDRVTGLLGEHVHHRNIAW